MDPFPPPPDPLQSQRPPGWSAVNHHPALPRTVDDVKRLRKVQLYTPEKPLKVICLISGGKDSIYSMLHVIHEGHHIVALGNLYPAKPAKSVDENDDPESHMYQTAGHTLIPQLAQCLRYPLYRRQIQGTAVSTATTFDKPLTNQPNEDHDEVDDLAELLKTIKEAHPEADAVSTGAILSTYQRTRIESVALAAGLTPLAYLWQYPSLWQNHDEDKLLEDMQVMKMEARIVKVASGGLSERDLWTNVASLEGRTKIKRLVSRFGEGEGAVIGEGGEYETFVVDGPPQLFKNRLFIQEKDRVVVKGESGTASLAIKKGPGKIIPKRSDELESMDLTVEMEIPDLGRRHLALDLPVPSLLCDPFEGFVDGCKPVFDTTICTAMPAAVIDHNLELLHTCPHEWVRELPQYLPKVNSEYADYPDTISILAEDMESALKHLDEVLEEHNKLLATKEVVSVTLLLSSMSLFESYNAVYKAYFNRPNPPTRVCVGINNILPEDFNVLMHCALSPFPKETLHVQSRSYWAPANIGPYSQAKTFPLAKNLEAVAVAIAGQIHLNPTYMQLQPWKTANNNVMSATDLARQCAIALQHVWRIGAERGVSFFIGGTCATKKSAAMKHTKEQAQCAGEMWRRLHQPPRDEETEEGDDDDEDVDLWELQNRRGEESFGSSKAKKTIPDWGILRNLEKDDRLVTPFWFIELDELPMDAMIEWIPGLGIKGGDIRVLPRIDHEWKMASWKRPHRSRIHRVVVDGRIMFTTIIQTLEDEDGNDKTLHLKREANNRYLDQMIGSSWVENLQDLVTTGVILVEQFPREVKETFGTQASTPDAIAVAQQQIIDLAMARVEKYYVDFVRFSNHYERPDADVPNMIPCRSIFDENGKKLVCVAVLRDVFEKAAWQKRKEQEEGEESEGEKEKEESMSDYKTAEAEEQKTEEVPDIERMSIDDEQARPQFSGL